MYDLKYNGTTLTWVTNGNKSYKATSGMPLLVDLELMKEVDGRNAKFQYDKSGGPCPEGSYRVPVFDNGVSQVIGRNVARNAPKAERDFYCDLAATHEGGIQEIPEFGQGNCDNFQYAGWGRHRLRMFKVSIKYPNRDNFYIHDSTKGYSHGCIEVEGRFFDDLKLKMYSDINNRFELKLLIQYPSPTATTDGGTGL